MILFRRPEQVDFFKAIRDMDYAGHCVTDIAKSLGESESTVRGWKNGHMPQYEPGRAFVLLYVDTLKREPPSKPFQITPEVANEFA